MLLENAADVTFPHEARDMVAEANHRIANNLSLVAAMARRQHASLRDREADISAEQARQMLAELIARLDAVGRLHRMMSSTGSDAPVDVAAYLQRIASEVVASMTTPDAVVLHFGCQLGCWVPPERALHLGLIVMELVINSLKHAHPARIKGRIEVRCRLDPNAVVVTVSDDGVGLPEAFAHGDTTHSGMRLIHSLARRIGASVRFDSGNLGLRCEISAPIANAVENAGILAD